MLDYFMNDGGFLHKWNNKERRWDKYEPTTGETQMDETPTGAVGSTLRVGYSAGANGPSETVDNPNNSGMTSSPPQYVDYKYNEQRYVGEIQTYIDSTYDQHYSKNNFQATEFIIDGGHGTGFCIGNVLKYAQRYGRKGNPDDWRKDLMKVIHYAIIQLHVHDLENSKGENK